VIKHGLSPIKPAVIAVYSRAWWRVQYERCFVRRATGEDENANASPYRATVLEFSLDTHGSRFI
jgi:hypothetical protein